MYAEPCIRPARVVVREIHLASEHAADSPCTPVAPRTLTSKPAPVVRGESPRFVARIRPKAASGDGVAAWFLDDARFMRGPGCASLTRATGRGRACLPMRESRRGPVRTTVQPTCSRLARQTHPRAKRQTIGPV